MAITNAAPVTGTPYTPTGPRTGRVRLQADIARFQFLGEGVQLCVQGLLRGRGTGVAEADVPDRFGAGAHGPGQRGPRRARLAYGGGRHAERLGELGHEAEAGGVVLDGHVALAGPARGARRGGAGLHVRGTEAVADLQRVRISPNRIAALLHTLIAIHQKRSSLARA